MNLPQKLAFTRVDDAYLNVELLPSLVVLYSCLRPLLSVPYTDDICKAFLTLVLVDCTWTI
jgi:hypothetical protein